MKKLFLLSFIFLLTAFVSSKVAWAAEKTTTGGTMGGGVWFVQPPDVWQQKVFGLPSTGTTGGGGGGSSGFGGPTTSNLNEMFKERYTLSILTDIANSVIAAVGGTPTTVQTPQGPVQQRSGGAISILAGLTGALYTTPPASSVEYLADLGQNLGIVKPAYAQGLGFSAFSPVLTLWKTFRDIAYLGFVVIFVIVGFMVMFRKRIDPRTVVTIQEALPNLVIALIIVTFSYAIVGLLVDFMEFLNYLIVNLLVKGTSGGPLLSPQQTQAFLQTNVLNLVWDFYASVKRLGDSISGYIKLPTDFILKGMVEITVTVVFTLMLFFNMFKIFFMLLGSYVGIILSLLFSPLQTIQGAFPGGKSSLSWIRGLIANLLVFPATLAMLLIAYQFTTPRTPSWQALSKAVVPQNFTWAPALIGTWPAPGVGPLISFGIILAIPAIGQAIKQALEVKETGLAGVAEKEMRGGLAGLPIIGGVFR